VHVTPGEHLMDSGHTDGGPAGRGHPRFGRGWPRAKQAVVVGVARGTITVAAVPRSSATTAPHVAVGVAAARRWWKPTWHSCRRTAPAAVDGYARAVVVRCH
jgi:hypothetical protein